MQNIKSCNDIIISKILEVLKESSFSMNDDNNRIDFQIHISYLLCFFSVVLGKMALR